MRLDQQIDVPAQADPALNQLITRAWGAANLGGEGGGSGSYIDANGDLIVADAYVDANGDLQFPTA